MTRDQIWQAILAERARQAAKWGGSHDWGHGDCSSDGVPDLVKLAVLGEECGEAAEAASLLAAYGRVARAVLDRKPDDLRTELIQVAAVAVAWLESAAP